MDVLHLHCPICGRLIWWKLLYSRLIRITTDVWISCRRQTRWSIRSSAHGKFYKEPLNLYTPPVQEEEEIENTGWAFVTMDYSQLSLAYMMGQMFGRDGGSSGSTGAIGGGSYLTADLNGDALPDLVNFNNGTVYFGMPDGRFFKDSFGGQLFFSDFNKDGLDDYVVYHDSKFTIHIVQPEGGTKSKDILSGFTCTKIWCRDVDNDGDSDLVLCLKGASNFIAVLENDGKRLL